MIADTSFVIDTAKDHAAIGKARQLEREDVTITVGSPTVFELFAGVAWSRKAEEEKSENYDRLVSTQLLVWSDPDPLYFGEVRVVGGAGDP